MILKIGGIKYQVKYVSPTDLDEEGKNGMTNFEKSTIYINKNQDKQQLQATLIHEVIHCLNNQLDEPTVEFLAQGIYQILIDNKIKYE